MLKFIGKQSLFGVFLLACSCAFGGFPNQPVRLVVPLATGGGGDHVARYLAPHLQKQLHQPVVVDNRPGGATVIGSATVANAEPDGYTLLLATSSHTINSNFVSLPFDPHKDFKGVSLLATSPLVLTVNPKKTDVNSLEELLDLARTKPNGLTYASSGLGGLPHLSGELLSLLADVKLLHVPYRGGGPAEADLLSGQVDMYFGSPSSMMPHVKVGNLRMIASTGAERSDAFNHVPTLSESFPGNAAETYYAILAPAGTPDAVIERLYEAVVTVLKDEGVRKGLSELGVIIVGASPSETMAYLQTQASQWQRVVKDSGIKLP